MLQNYTMKLTKYLICSVLLIVGAKGINAKEIQIRSLEECRNYALSKADFRGIREVWASIRQGAIETWNYIKSVAESTKEKIKKFIGNVKEYANELLNRFQEKIQELREKLNNIVADIYGTGELVKQCTIEQKNMEHIFKEIMAHMGQCIAEEINQLASWSNDEPEPVMNQTMFIRNLDAKIDLCEQDMENVQECLCKVREDIFDNFTDMENNLLKNHFEARSIADDIKGTLVTCSISNLIEATNLISVEIVEIAQCVIEKSNEADLQEINNKV